MTQSAAPADTVSALMRTTLLGLRRKLRVAFRSARRRAESSLPVPVYPSALVPWHLAPGLVPVPVRTNRRR